MWQPEEILKLVGETIKIAKPYISHRKETRWMIVEDKDGQLPEYWDGYNASCANIEAIKTHSEKGYFPHRLFDERSPNQTDEEFDYIKANYKQTTLPVFIDYLSSITRPFHRSNWSINYATDEPQFQDFTLEDYLSDLNGMSLESFMRHIVPAIKTKDAEGVIAVKPMDIPFERNAEGDLILDEEGNATISDMELLEPVPVYYSSKKIRSYQINDHLFVELDEKSPVTEGTRTVMAGLVYEFYDDVNIWRVVQVGKRNDYTFQLFKYFEHNGGLPVTKLKGVPIVTGSGIKYESPFLFSTDNLDLVALNQSNLQASINKCVYPVRVMVGDACDFEDSGSRCDGGMIGYTNEHGVYNRKSCPSCNGSGLKSRLSPMGELLLKPETREGAGDTTIREPLSYVAPEVSTLEFLRSEIKEHENRARAILHLKTTNDTAQGGEDATATARAIDLKALASFVNVISDQMFDIYEFIVDQIGWQRYGDQYNAPQIIRPTTFDYTTEEDYINQISMMTEAGTPPMVIHQVLINYLKTVYFTEEKSSKVFTLIIHTDRLLGLNNETIQLKVARGSVQTWEDILHCSALSLVKELELENPDFLEQDLVVQREQLIEKAKSKETTQEADVVNSIIGG